MGCCRRNGFLDIDQAKTLAVFLLFADAQQYGKPQSSQGAAALHPVGGIHDSHLIMFVAVFKRRDEVAHFRKFKYALDLFLFRWRDRPEPLTHWNLRSHVFNTLFGQMVPSPLQGAFQHAPHGCRHGTLSWVFPRIGKDTFISFHHLFEHERGRHAWQILSPDSSCQREPEANEIVDRVSDNGLVQVPDSNLHPALGVGDWTQISQMAIAADPDGRTLRQGPGYGRTQPFVKL